MLHPQLYKVLVPDAPLHRHTERDLHPSRESALRARSGNFLREEKIQPGLQSPSLVSSFKGTIETILFAFPGSLIKDPQLADGYESLVNALRVGTQVIVVHNKSFRADVEALFSSAGHTGDRVIYVPLPDYVSFTDWAEDAYVALQDAADASNYLMEPWEFPRAGDALIAESVQEHALLQAAQAPLIFQGGNCLIGDDFWLLGKDYFADSVNLLQESRPPVTVPDNTTPESFVRQLFSDYLDSTRRLVVVGTNRQIPLRASHGTRAGDEFFLDLAGEGVGTFQPIFHIDMFITLVGPGTAGKFEVFVGSPALADQLLGTSSPFGLDNAYDAIARQLSAAGMMVRRNPLVHRPTVGRTFALGELRQLSTQPDNEALLKSVDELVAAGADERTSVKVRTWHHITWNNCLVENSEAEGKNVYMPTFGHGENSDLRTVDQQMRTTWESLGFTVHMLGDFNGFARRQGLVHCIKKYLSRGG